MALKPPAVPLSGAARPQMPYFANTDAEREEMLRAIGADSIDDLFADIPDAARLTDPLNLPPAAWEEELRRDFGAMAARNRTLQSGPSFLGAGVYRHFIPAVVDPLIFRNEFYTAYTPYQPEASQGTLQATFEFQSLLADLLEMNVVNASMYDGSTALAEAILMAADLTGRTQVILSGAVHPEYRRVVQTYLRSRGLELIPVGGIEGEGVTPTAAVAERLGDGTACVVVQQPNFFGCVEDVGALAQAAHNAGALLVQTSTDLTVFGALKPPGAWGVNIVAAEGQSLGVAPGFGGPHLGIIATEERFVRRIPGRLVGMTKDIEGQRGFVLTLQTREQHIRRDRAASNICTNNGLLAIAAAVYLAALGPEGLRRVALHCVQGAHRLARLLGNLPGVGLMFEAPYFHEFVLRLPKDASEVNERLLDRGIIGGLPLGDEFPELRNCMLLCVTETNTPDDWRRLYDALKEVTG